MGKGSAPCFCFFVEKTGQFLFGELGGKGRQYLPTREVLNYHSSEPLKKSFLGPHGFLLENQKNRQLYRTNQKTSKYLQITKQQV